MLQPSDPIQCVSKRCRPTACAARKASFQLGFTLVEMLVVLLIVGMVSGLLFDGAAQLMSMQARLERQLTAVRGEALRADWLRQLVQGIQPDYPDGKQIFKGSAQGFSGLTTAPLSEAYGALQPFTVTLTHDATNGKMLLAYGRGSDTSVLLSWPGGRGALLYLDAGGAAHEDWPPPLGLWPQLPRAVVLEGERDGMPWLVVAAPFGPTLPNPRPSDMTGVMR